MKMPKYHSLYSRTITMIVFEQVCTVIIVIIIIRCELNNPPGGLHTSAMFIFATFIFALQNNRSKYSVRVGE